MRPEEKKQGYDTCSFLINLATDLSKKKTSKELIEIIPSVIFNATGLSRAAILLTQEKPDILKFESVSRFPKDLVGTIVTLKQFNLNEDALARGDTLFVNTDDLKVNEILRMFLKRINVRKLLIAPLSGVSVIRGLLIADKPGLDFEFSDEEISIVNAIAHQVTSALENILLKGKLLLGADLSNALNKIDKAIASSLDYDEIMNKVISLASEAVGADSAMIVMPEKEGWKTNYVYGDKMQDLKGHIFSEQQIVRSLIADKIGQPILIKIPEKDARADKWLAQKYGIKSSIDIALKVGDRFIGNADFHYYSQIKKFDMEKIDFLNKVSVSLTLALQNAILYKKQHIIAETLQEAIISVPSKIKGLEIGHLYRSATESARIGGDFFDVFEIDNDNVGVLIGDVAGKGIFAANTTALVSNSVAAFSSLSKSPANILSRVNDLLSKKLVAEDFVSVFLGVLDTKNNRLVYCNAGHQPAILKKANGNFTYLHSNSQILGLYPETFRQETCEFYKNDTLLMYTDGVVEAKKWKEEYGDDRLREVFSNNEDINVLAKQIHKSISNFTGGHLIDDIAILALKFIG